MVRVRVSIRDAAAEEHKRDLVAKIKCQTDVTR